MDESLRRLRLEKLCLHLAKFEPGQYVASSVLFSHLVDIDLSVDDYEFDELVVELLDAGTIEQRPPSDVTVAGARGPGRERAYRLTPEGRDNFVPE